MSLRILDASRAREILGDLWPDPIDPRCPFERALHLQLEDGDMEVDHFGIGAPDREIGHINDEGDFVLDRTLALDEYATALAIWERSPYRHPGRLSVRSGPRSGGIGSDMSPGVGALPYRVSATLHGLRRLNYRRKGRSLGLREMLEIACRHEPDAGAMVERAVAGLERYGVPA